ncbi:MAG: helix-turn-helix transcriptional regulator [Pseudomonadales bacterium]
MDTITLNLDVLSRAIASLGTDDFYPELIATLSSIAPLEHPEIWLFRQDNSPVPLYHRASKNEAPVLIDEYMAGAYTGDPAYQASQKPDHEGIYRTTDMRGSEALPEYIHGYFRRMAVSDELGYLIDPEPGSAINISLQRDKDAPRFSDNEVKQLHQMASVISELVRKHWQLNDRQPTATTEANVTLALELFGSSLLTGREAEVLHQLLRGHSNQSAADKLGISLETLRRHRKHIYQKLDISSQSELFSLFIHCLPYITEAPDQDPLAKYQSPPTR